MQEPKIKPKLNIQTHWLFWSEIWQQVCREEQSLSAEVVINELSTETIHFLDTSTISCTLTNIWK